jgi:hypothetical protein
MSIESILERQATALESIAKSLATVEACFSVDGLAAILETTQAAAVKVSKATISNESVKVTTKPAETKPVATEKTKEAEVIHPTEDDVKKALQGYVAKAKELGLDEVKAKDEAKAIVKDAGKADGVSKLAPEKRQAVIDAAAEKAKALKAPAVEEKAKVNEVKHPSEEEVRDALRELSKETSREVAKALALKHGGAEGVVDIPPEKRKAVIDAAAVALEDAQKAAASGDDF